MKQIVGVSVLCYVFATALAFERSTDGDDICHGLECPKFTVLNKTADWELRRYEATTWVATNATAMKGDTVRSALFHKLFEYISGNNEEGEKINMTAPVATKVIHGQGPNCESEFVMHFMVPRSYWSAPIQPKDKSVFITEIPALDVYVRQFGGFAEESDFINAVKELSESLQNSKLPVKEEFFFEASYDGPYTFRHRHNEVWLVKS